MTEMVGQSVARQKWQIAGNETKCFFFLALRRAVDGNIGNAVDYIDRRFCGGCFLTKSSS